MRKPLLLCILLVLARCAIDTFEDAPSRFGVAGNSNSNQNFKCAPRSTPQMRNNGDYDFIVVGGGAAGNAMAARLAEDTSVKVLLLESGKDIIGDPKVMDETMRELFPMDYCVKGQTDADCGWLTLPVHFVDTPFFSLYMSTISNSYYYPTTPQLYANKREIYYPRGNVLGGSSATNTMVPFRGKPEVYDDWAARGLEGWSYKDVLPFFKKLETNHDFQDPKIHGTSGPIHLTNVSDHHNFPLVDELLKAAWSMGYPKIEDFANPDHHYGAGYWQQLVNDKGRRTSSYEYLRDLMKKDRVCLDREDCKATENLHIKTNALVTELVFDGKRATGVKWVDSRDNIYRARRYNRDVELEGSEGKKSQKGMEYWKSSSRHPIQNCPVDESIAFDYKHPENWWIPPHKDGDLKGTVRSASAKREVVLSAGTINSAQLLMLAGIGPKDHLEAQGIPVKVDLPVGQRVQDHEEVAMSFKMPSSFDPPWHLATQSLRLMKEWSQGKTNALSANHIPGGMDISSAGPSGTDPSVHVHFIQLYAENLDFQHWVKPDSDKMLPTKVTDFLTFNGLKYHTMMLERIDDCSYGSITLKSTNPLEPPFLDPNYGTCKKTNDELVWAVKEMRKMNSLLPKKFQGEEVFPGKDVQTDDQILEWIRNFVFGHHISASVPMGNCSDPYSVLDNKGRVYGIDGLRVADASVFPRIPGGNIVLPTYMVAERIADFIKKEYNMS